MQPVSLGRSGLKVSPMCLGTMTFADTTDLEVARQIADLCLARGVFFWDTADAYSTGASEAMVGKLMAGRRQEIVLATKVFAAMGPGAKLPLNCGWYKRKAPPVRAGLSKMG